MPDHAAFPVEQQLHQEDLRNDDQKDNRERHGCSARG
jgi:hypothetical protein